MSQTSNVSKAPFSADERGEIRAFMLYRRHLRWLLRQSKIWVKWISGTAAIALAVVHYGNDFLPAIFKLLSILRSGS